MVSIRRYLGCLKGWLGGPGRVSILALVNIVFGGCLVFEYLDPEGFVPTRFALT